MRVENFVPHISTGESNNSFVGIKIIGNQIHFHYPESYHINLDDLDSDDILNLLRSFSLSKSESADKAKAYNTRQNNSNEALVSYIWIIEDYLKHGFYYDSEKTLCNHQRGKVNWKRTLQQQPMICDRNIVYHHMITETNSPLYSIIAEAFRFCVKRSSMLIGWLYGVKPESIEITTSSDQVPKYIDAVNRELNTSFEDSKRTRLFHMQNVLIGLDEVKDDQSIVFGVDSYHYIFERMIDKVFGNETVEKYYPKFTWHLEYSSIKNLSGPTIRPDTIMRYENDVFIIDSKFYRFGSLDLSKTDGLPEASSVVKQLSYGSYVASIDPRLRVFNVFILPYDSCLYNGTRFIDESRELVYVGNVASEWNEHYTYSRIYTFLIDLHHVVKTWNKLNHDVEKELLIKKIRQLQKAF